MITNEELTKRIDEAGRIRRWYQAVPYGDVVPPSHFDDGLTNAKSFGEGRWSNYIEPMIERISDEMDSPNAVFCDVGCSAGLFLLKAWQRFGFRRLLAVEGAEGGYQQLLITRDYYDQIPLLTYNVAVGQLEKNIANDITPLIDMETFPMSDLTLMSCIHYHIMEEDLIAYLKRLASKSLYLILVTDEGIGDIISGASEHFCDIIGRAEGWQQIDELRTPREWLDYEGPDRCKDLTALMFRSEILRRLSVQECFERQLRLSTFNRIFYTHIFPLFIEGIIEGRITQENYLTCSVYRWQAEARYGSKAWPPKVAAERTLSYLDMVLTIKEHGQEQPIGLQEHLGMVDPWNGFHRIAVLNHLGVKYVYGKEVIPDVRP